nr:uncharacterized PE-PGRS family protein PE_PGRS54-like [Aegilops tauschii subsp. strangulata]
MGTHLTRAIACAGAGCGRGARARGQTGLAPDAARDVGTGSQNAGQWGASRGGWGEARDGDGAAVPELVAEAGDGGRATASSGEARAWLDAKARGGGRGRRDGVRSRREVRAEAVDVAAERERARGGDVVRGRRARVEQRVRARDDAAAVSACVRQKEERRRLRLTGAVGKGQWSTGRKPGTSRRRGGRRRGPGGGGAPASAMWSNGVRGGAAWSRQRSGRRWTAKGVRGGAGFDPPFPIQIGIEMWGQTRERAIVCAGAGCGRGARVRGRTGLAPDAARDVGTGSQNAGQWGGASRGGRGEARDGDGAAVPELVAEAGDGGRATASSGEARAWLDAKARGGGRGRRGGARSRREVRTEAVDVAAERERARGGDVVRGGVRVWNGVCARGTMPRP